MAQTKTPKEVTDAIKKLDGADQVAVQTFIAKLKATIADLEAQLSSADDSTGHAHYHGHEKCTHDHGHSHDHSPSIEVTHGGDEGEAHSHVHEHDHDHCGNDHDDDIPAWKKKAMAEGASSDPMAAPFGGSWTTETSVNAQEDDGDKKRSAMDEEQDDDDEEDDFPPLYDDSGDGEGDDHEKAATLKMEASDLKATGDYADALGKFTEAILAARPSALLYANRADCLLRLDRPRAAVRDCDEALKANPDSAKALRIRGRALKARGEWRDSRRDLSASQTIDFDDAAAEDLKFVSEKVKELEAEETKARLKEEEKMRKRAEEIKRAKEEAAAEASTARASSGASASAAASATSGAGMPGGMPGGIPPGMQGIMSALMSDPELAAGMKNPKVVAAFADLMQQPGGAMGLMSNPAKIQQLMSDPDIGPFMKKLMTKLGPMMAGGMGGMGGMAGMGGADGATNVSGPGDDDMPDTPQM